jgi:hypothetical protein
MLFAIFTNNNVPWECDFLGFIGVVNTEEPVDRIVKDIEKFIKKHDYELPSYEIKAVRDNNLKLIKDKEEINWVYIGEEDYFIYIPEENCQGILYTACWLDSNGQPFEVVKED